VIPLFSAIREFLLLSISGLSRVPYRLSFVFVHPFPATK
jgi:hypothetical protein